MYNSIYILHEFYILHEYTYHMLIAAMHYIVSDEWIFLHVAALAHIFRFPARIKIIKIIIFSVVLRFFSGFSSIHYNRQAYLQSGIVLEPARLGFKRPLRVVLCLARFSNASKYCIPNALLHNVPLLILIYFIFTLFSL